MTPSHLPCSPDENHDSSADSILYEDREATPEELRGMLARAATGNGWDAPGMEAYDRYDEERRHR